MKKALDNPKYGPRWFPKRDITRHTRANNPFLEEKACGNRLYNSPIFAMRRKLNDRQQDNVVDLSVLFNDPYNQ